MNHWFYIAVSNLCNGPQTAGNDFQQTADFLSPTVTDCSSWFSDVDIWISVIFGHGKSLLKNRVQYIPLKLLDAELGSLFMVGC